MCQHEITDFDEKMAWRYQFKINMPKIFVISQFLHLRWIWDDLKVQLPLGYLGFALFI